MLSLSVHVSVLSRRLLPSPLAFFAGCGAGFLNAAGTRRGVQERARSLADAQWMVGLCPEQCVHCAGAAEVAEAWVLVSEHGRRPGGRQSTVQPGNVPLARALAEHGCRGDTQPSEGIDDCERLGDIPDNDGHPARALLAIRVPGHIPVGEDVPQRALARANHADEVQQAVDAQRHILLEPARLGDQQFDPFQPIRPVPLLDGIEAPFFRVHFPGRRRQFVPGHGDRLALATGHGVEVEGGPRADRDVGRGEVNPVTPVSNREPVRAIGGQRDATAAERRRRGEQVLERLEARGGAGGRPPFRCRVGAGQQVAAELRWHGLVAL